MIDAQPVLADFLPKLSSAEWVALDTEADSLHAYPEKLCLLQISIPGADRLVDPLSGIDLTPIWPILQQHELIMHGSDYDLRLLRKNHGFVPSRIFDTMLASRLLGDREFGLTNLVSRYLNVTLDKGSQKADWARRPLTSRMEEYARNDTHYLKPLRDLLAYQLKEKHRLKWLEESCQRLIRDCAEPSAPDPETVWRVKGSHTLSRGGLAVLREIWQWRETEAVRANKPPYFVLSHESLVEIARAVSEERSFALPRHFSSRRADALHHAITIAQTLPPQQHPHPLRSMPRRQTEEERRRFEALQKRRDKHAVELAIDPTLIASRATLLQLAQDFEGHRKELMHWQRELLEQ
ncbi:MAG: ribonuclease D [Limisphaerales bacterium]